jgi:hypothetical protein
MQLKAKPGAAASASLGTRPALIQGRGSRGRIISGKSSSSGLAPMSPVQPKVRDVEMPHTPPRLTISDQVQEMNRTNNNNPDRSPVPNNNNNNNNDKSSSSIKPSESRLSSDYDYAMDDVLDDIQAAAQDVKEVLDDVGEAVEDLLPDAAGINDFLDWATILVLMFGITYRVTYIRKAASLHIYLMDLEAARAYDSHLEEIMSKFQDIQSLDEIIHLIALAVIGVGILQFFRYLQFDRRFGIVTSTIAESAKDLVPVLVIFLSIVIAYAVLASQIYGVQMVEFSTAQSSLAALFIILLGNFDYYASKYLTPLSLLYYNLLHHNVLLLLWREVAVCILWIHITLSISLYVLYIL